MSKTCIVCMTLFLFLWARLRWVSLESSTVYCKDPTSFSCQIMNNRTSLRRAELLFTPFSLCSPKDAVEWLIADPRSGVVDLDGAIQMGQRMIEEGYVLRISREFKAQELRHFGRQQKAKRHFRSGDAIYRFDNLRISPFLVRGRATCKRSECKPPCLHIKVQIVKLLKHSSSTYAPRRMDTETSPIDVSTLRARGRRS